MILISENDNICYNPCVKSVVKLLKLFLTMNLINSQ